MLATLAILAVALTPPPAASPLWIEGEHWFTQRGSHGPDRPPFASAGECLGSGWGASRTHEVVYRFALDAARGPTTLYLRYARQPSEPGRFALLLDETPLSRPLDLPSTGAWGHRAATEWRYHCVPLGPLAEGWHTLTLVSLADNNNTNLDGLFLAGTDFIPPAARPQIEAAAKARFACGPDAPGPDCVADELTLEQFSGRLDDWYYPAEEPAERAALAIPRLVEAVPDHAVLASGQERTPPLPLGGAAYGWRLAAVLPGASPVAVLEREFDRWGLILYLDRQGVVAEVRKSVGRLEKIARPQIRFPKNYFEDLLAAEDDVLGRKILANHAEASYGALAGCLAPLETYTFLGAPAMAQKFVVYPDGSLGTDPNATRFAPSAAIAFDAAKLLPKLDAPAAKRGVLGAWLPAIDYGFFDPTGRRGCELCALADTDRPQALVRVRQADGATRYYRTPPLEPVAPAEFYAALLRVQRYWERLFAPGMQCTLADRRAWDVARACIARALAGCPGDHPKYGMGAYWGRPDHHDGFPPTTLSLCTCLLEWGLADEAKRRLGYYFDHFVKPDGTLLYYGPAVAEYAQLLDLAAACVRRTADRAWLDRHCGAIERLADYLLRLLADARRQPAEALTFGLIQGAAEADTRDDQRYYISGNAWCWRGLFELSRLDGLAPEHRRRYADEAERLRRDLARAVERSVIAPQRFLPPVAGQQEVFRRMTESRLASYTNYRYWLETLSAGFLTPVQEQTILDYRLAHGGELLAMTRFSGHLDDWPYYHHAQGVLEHDRVDRYLLGYWAHIAHHQTQGTFTAYEQVPIRGWRERREKADYCVPSELTAPLMTRWMLVAEDPDADVLWLGRALPRAWLQHDLAMSGALTRWGPVGLRLSPAPDGRRYQASITLPSSARPTIMLRLRHPARLRLVECRTTGARCEQLDARAEQVRLRPESDRIEMTLLYRPD